MGINEFQFHKGTIRTTQAAEDAIIAKIFQFHKGTIRTIKLFLFYLRERHVFQFHKGTIRTSERDFTC